MKKHVPGDEAYIHLRRPVPLTHEQKELYEKNKKRPRIFKPGCVTIAFTQAPWGASETLFYTLIGVSYWSPSGKVFNRRESNAIARSRLRTCPLRMTLPAQGPDRVRAAFKEFMLAGPYDWKKSDTIPFEPGRFRNGITVQTEASYTLTGIDGYVRIDSRWNQVLTTGGPKKWTSRYHGPPAWVGDPPNWLKRYLEEV